ncbi:hypothetical protein BV25DRAFT_1901773 [Artomyces pyxidatus]|uniref:Uncharacterized protein n=1 Tax=Artomyces pyxidatus TaxID=48021 RepID=A0ACB8SRC5_9AGAM|nr:hypothetical protein BV25DRAFT_1901773 [Artomyces pyxidatus]
MARRCRPIPSTSSAADSTLMASNPPRLPTELIYDILMRSLGNYLSEILLTPGTVGDWDAIGTLLHISECFRCCMTKLLQYLWGGAFVDVKTGLVVNYKPTITVLRGLSHLAHTSPERLLQSPKARLLADRIVRTPLLPIVRMCKCFLVQVARARLCADQTTIGLPLGVLESDGSTPSMSEYLSGRKSLPPRVAHCLLARVDEHIVEHTAVWIRRKHPSFFPSVVLTARAT